MPKAKSNKSKKIPFKLDKVLELDRVFIILSLIYLPLILLFLENGTLAEITLTIYSAIIIALGVTLLSSFILYLSKSANDNSKNMGSLMLMYVLNVLIPLITFKLVAYVVWKLLPSSHEGILCDIKYLIIDLYRIFQPQTTINYLVIFSFTLVAYFTLKAVNHKG